VQFSEDYYAIDACSTKFVKQVGDYVSNTIHDIFSKGPKVPKVYSQMEKVITNWNAHHQAKLLITWECFVNSLCSQIHWLQIAPHGQDATIA
jgi:F0F1-type ATP synthase gamma subunit